MAFTKSASDQSISALLQLPTEIKLAILRNLMLSPRALQPLSLMQQGVDGTAEVDRWYDYSRMHISLSSQVMQCCQELYNLGTDVLYHQNTLSIWLDKSGTIYALGWAFLAPQFYIDNENPCFLSHTFRHSYTSDLNYSELWWLDAVQKFRNAHVLVEYSLPSSSDQPPGSSLFEPVAAELGRLLWCKHVTLEVSALLQHGGINSVRGLTRSFRVFRCQSFKFTSKRVHKDEGVGRNIETIVSHLPVQDLLHETLILDRVSHLFPWLKGLRHYLAEHGMHEGVRQAVEEQNEPAFEICKSFIQKHAEIWIQDHLKWLEIEARSPSGSVVANMRYQQSRDDCAYFKQQLDMVVKQKIWL